MENILLTLCILFAVAFVAGCLLLMCIVYEDPEETEFDLTDYGDEEETRI